MCLRDSAIFIHVDIFLHLAKRSLLLLLACVLRSQTDGKKDFASDFLCVSSR